jgi:CHAD domain-containing protein
MMPLRSETTRLRRFALRGFALRLRRVQAALTAVSRNPNAQATHALSTTLKRLTVTDRSLRDLFGRRLLKKPLRRTVRRLRDELSAVRDLQEIRRKYVLLALPGPFARAFNASLADREENACRQAVEAVERFLEAKHEWPVLAHFRARPQKSVKALTAALLADAAALLPKAVTQKDDEALHELRLLFKRYRYTVELLAPDFSGADAVELNRLKRVQSALGEAHDWLVLSEELERFARKNVLPGAVKAATVVRVRRRRAHAEARAVVREEFARLSALEKMTPQIRAAE